MAYVQVQDADCRLTVRKVELIRRAGLWQINVEPSRPQFTLKASLHDATVLIELGEVDRPDKQTKVLLGGMTPLEQNFLGRCRWFFNRRQGVGTVILVDEAYLRASGMLETLYQDVLPAPHAAGVA